MYQPGAPVKSWGTVRRWCPKGSPVIPLEGDPSQSLLAVPLLWLLCLLGKSQPRLGASREHWGAGERRGEREAKRSGQGGARDA